MNIDKLLKPFKIFGVHLGLGRSHQLLADLGNPHQQVPIIHVAGTNGKGSVCAYLSSILNQAGYRVGRYTSPHLIDWTERICINEQPIASETLEQLLLQVIDAIQQSDDSPTLFEVFTAAAWLYFARQKCEIAVIEVGLGGRLDSTNVCDRPLATIITSISREHWQILGPTLTDIAREKAGILRPETPAIIGQLPPEAMTAVNQRIAELNCPAIYPKPALIVEPGIAEYQGIKYPLPLLGEMQLNNSALAIASLQVLQQHGWKISQNAIQEGIAKTVWPGRIQWLTWRNNRLLVDGAHNPEAARSLRQYIDTLTSQRVTWIMGILDTKEHDEIFKALLRPGDRIYLVPVPDRRSAKPERLAKLARTICPELAHCQAYPDLRTGLEAAFQIVETPTVLCGSLYLVGHFLGTLN